MKATKDEFPYINRDASWLSFNYRVLQEAKDPSVPLLERIKFLAIYSSNLDEFFRVRVGQLRNLVKVGKKARKELEFNPEKILQRVLKTVNRQQEEFSRIYEEEIVPELRQNKIFLLNRRELSGMQYKFIENYFQQNMLPFVQPVLLVKNKIKPFLNNGALYLAIFLESKTPEAGDKKDEQYAIVKIPSDHLPRFIPLPSKAGRFELIILDDIVRHNAEFLFPGYKIRSSHSLKLTRDAELYIEDEFSGDLIQKIKESLSKRSVGHAARLVYDRNMPRQLLQFLQETFELHNSDLLPEGRYHNNFDFFRFPDFGMDHLKNHQLPPLPVQELENTPDLFATIREKDYLTLVPFQSYYSVVRFFEIAARDPQVTHIKIVQYRVARQSRIMQALMDAVKAGKQVSVFVEIKARFDEEANLEWGERLEKAGVTVHYSFPGLKVHSKLALVIRQEEGKDRLYSYLSTGNFHEDTAKIYSDFCFFTAEKQLSREVARVFSFLESNLYPDKPFEHLLVGQFNLREQLTNLIDFEIKEAKAGRTGSIILKMNSLQDPQMIKKLYEASQAGVKIKMIIRGICSLVPGLPRISENIEVISIVDRFLEHARVFVFHNGGDEKIYLSSADWMVRNLSYRVETAFPLYDPDARELVKDILIMQFRDNVKARVLNKKQSNPYRKDASDINFRSQVETYFFLKRKME